jgi:hypothetical protein
MRLDSDRHGCLPNLPRDRGRCAPGVLVRPETSRHQPTPPGTPRHPTGSIRAGQPAQPLPWTGTSPQP